MIDFHSHILPDIDDGSRNMDITLEMLKSSYCQGIRTIVATPHFYPNRLSLDKFLKKRNEAFNATCDKTAELTDAPDIIVGAEVYYCNGISELDGLERLTVNESKYLLLEMPFETWSDRVYTEVEKMIYNNKLIPVIAHLERYIHLQNDKNNIARLLDMGVLVQMNGEFFNNVFTRGKAINYLKNGVVDVIGSDCHNMDKRAPNLGRTYEIIRKKCGEDTVDKLIKLSRAIINNEPVKY